MAEYIEREAAIDALQNHYEVRNAVQNGIMDECVMLMMQVPAADVAPVRHGRWREVEHGESGVLCECSACKEWMLFYYGFVANFCPNCGARMDLKGDADV